ncbi:antibiotic biosynthesis monooxygenase [Arthrobacter sp. NPDC089319]|uniref:antibiotic biosynthesis monooxygenase family protein n=1 Tax=Arthrobacter sp. NPDC089319 TaxID=3155915 RepID=UPI003449C60A
MVVLTKSHVTDLTREQYEGLAAVLTDKLKAAPGFIAHYAWEHEDGMSVVEIWDSDEQHDAWFENNVKPNLPVQVIPEKHELVNKVTA